MLGDSMIKIPRLGLNTGGEIPAIGFGTWQIAGGDETVKAVSEALNAGYRLIDTAKIYGNERGVGEAIRISHVPREEVFVTTKLWPSDFGYDSAKQAFVGSLRRLGLAYIDLYLMHWPSHDKDRRRDAWRALCEIYKDGRAKAIGVSNYDIEHLEEVLSTSDIVPAVNQIEFHPYIYEKQEPVLKKCAQHKIIVEAYSPLSRGLGLNNITVNDVAELTGRTPAQVVLRWALQHDTVPIPKSATPERIHDNIKVFDFELSSEDMRRLDDLSR